MPPTGTRRRGTALGPALAGAIGLIGLLGACVTKALTPQEARDTYAPAVESVASALTGDLGWKWTVRSQATVQQADGACAWFSGTRVAPAAAQDDWPRVIAATNEALRDDGFASITQTNDVTGGFVGVTTSDEHDATVRITSKSDTTLWLSVPVSGDC